MPKGFEWNGYVKAQDAEFGTVLVFGGNFFLEMVLPNALKLNSFTKLRDRLEKYIKTHGDNFPEQIIVNKRQYQEYLNLFTRIPNAGAGNNPPVPSYQGIPIYVRK